LVLICEPQINGAGLFAVGHLVVWIRGKILSDPTALVEH
jgi:hypothetical protein